MKDPNSESFEAELQAVFLAEAQEMLEDTEAAFMQIETHPNDSSKIDKIFRLVHTIKGSAHIAGFADLGAFAHRFETLIGALRDKKLAVNSDVVDVLLAGNDCLTQFVEQLRQDSNAVVSTVAIEAKITALVPGALVMPKGKDTASKNIPPARTAASHAPAVTPAAVTAPQVANPAAGREAKPTLSVVRDSSTKEALETTPKRVVLVCDDDEDIVVIMATILEDGGYTVVRANDGTSGLKIMRERPIDFILTDLKMPGIDGLTFVKEVRKFNQNIPVAFVSGHSSREHLREFLKYGVDEFLEKPFAAEDLLAIAQRATKLKCLRESMLAVSQFSFRAYVSMQKLDVLAATGATTNEIATERAVLAAHMDSMRQATLALLESERAVKSS